MLAHLLLVCLVVGCAKVNPEDAKIMSIAKTQAELIQTALIRGDHRAVIDLTHPTVVNQLGGRDQAIATMTRGLDEMRAGGVSFKSVTMDEPHRPIRANGQVYVVVPFELEMSAPGKRLLGKGAVLGISTDGGTTWAFIDTMPGRAALKRMFPDLPDALDFPSNQKPRVLDD